MDEPNKQEVVKLEGDINFTRVIHIRKEGERKILKHPRIQFDFSNVLHCDSSALVLLLAWKRFAKANSKRITFSNLPCTLLSLAGVCNIKSMLVESTEE